MTCSSVSLLLPTSPFPNFKGRLFSRVEVLPLSSSAPSEFTIRIPTNWNRAARSNRFHVKSADSERGQQPTNQFTQGSNGPPTDGGSKNPSTNFLSVLCPLLKLFSGGDPSAEKNAFVEVATSSLSTLARFPWGSTSQLNKIEKEGIIDTDPPLLLQLYEFEACPFCRRVREAITELDLPVEIYPCPKGSLRHREMVRDTGGKEQFPFLVDPNTGISLYESGDIVKYLFQQYGKGTSPTTGLIESTLFTGWVPTILRAGRGMSLWVNARKEPPSEKLELFSYENNPYARLVREVLCELELPYILRTVGYGSRRLNMLLETSGSNEVPYLMDPNTGAKVGDYRKILSYLFQTYSSVTV